MKSYDDSKPSKYIMYLDEKKLYGLSMSQYLPYSGLKWLNQKEIDIDVNSIGKNSSDGYMLEVDLKCPDELHVLHNDYPLPPEKLAINHNMMSNYCSSVANKYDIKIGDVDKLVPNLGNKDK